VTGILGGRFDPPHNGHVALARAAIEQLGLDRLVVLVAERPGHQGTVASAADRLAMAQAAFAGLGEVELDPHAYTVDAVRGGRFGDDAYFVVGRDQADAFQTWKDPEQILKWVTLAVGTRSGYPGTVSFEFDSPPISGSDIRARVGRGEPIDDLVPPQVARLIDELRLYR
jgi:nicotinate-nucleotide adenylyltransferase